jgi:hypothetical protein
MPASIGRSSEKPLSKGVSAPHAAAPLFSVHHNTTMDMKGGCWTIVDKKDESHDGSRDKSIKATRRLFDDVILLFWEPKP